MKKVIIGIVILGGLGLSSCDKCKLCTHSSSNSVVEICKGTGPGSQTEFKAEETSYELNGYDCQ